MDLEKHARQIAAVIGCASDRSVDEMAECLREVDILTLEEASDDKVGRSTLILQRFCI